MNDKEFDKLMGEAIGREAMLETINRNVMKTVRRSTRRRRMGKLLQMVAVAFGLPLLLVNYGWFVFRFLVEKNVSAWGGAVAAALFLIVAASYVWIIKKFVCEKL